MVVLIIPFVAVVRERVAFEGGRFLLAPDGLAKSPGIHSAYTQRPGIQGEPPLLYPSNSIEDSTKFGQIS